MGHPGEQKDHNKRVGHVRPRESKWLVRGKTPDVAEAALCAPSRKLQMFHDSVRQGRPPVSQSTRPHCNFASHTKVCPSPTILALTGPLL